MTPSNDAAPQLVGPDTRGRRARRELARRQAIRRRRAVAVLVLAVLATAIALAAGSLGGGTPARGTQRASVAAHGAGRAGGAQHSPRAARPGAPPPGSLPQTHAYPSARSAQFKSLMASLWSGIVHDSLARALVAFFPEEAYARLKAIGSASSDWSGRLVGDFRLDIDAAHSLLGSEPTHARLLAVNVPSSYGHWVQPGVCYNSIGYYEVPNARVVYRQHGEVRSFGIASMISWRGVWYVVHLGAILRSGDTGEVDEPASGPGTSAYSGTC